MMPSALLVSELVGSPRIAFTSAGVMPLWIFWRLSSVSLEQAVSRRIEATVMARALREIFWSGFFIVIILSVAFAHDEIEAAQNRDDVGHHVAGQKLPQDAQV